MLLERKSPTIESTQQHQPDRAPKHRWAIFAGGALLFLLAVHGQWDIAIAAWLSGVLLLRVTRTSRLLPGSLAIGAVTVAGLIYFMGQGGMEVLSPLVVLCVLLGAVFVVPYVLDRLLTPRITHGLLRTLVFPLAIVAVEYVIASATPIGNMLNSLAATQHENLPLLQLASVTGSYGVSFLVAWFASIANHAWENGLAWPRIKTVSLTFAGILALVVVGGTIRLAFFAPTAETVRVAGVTWSRSADDKASALLDEYPSLREAPAEAVRGAAELVNADLLASTVREARAGAKVVSWPEAGARVLEADRAELLERVGAVAAQEGVYVGMGLGVVTETPPYSRNEAVLVAPSGKALWTYEKAHPVPFMDTTIPGDGVVPTADTPHGRIANVICFDAEFPTLMRQARGVDLMLVPSNDWKGFGQTHTEKATVRAVENGYSLLRQDSNGLSRIVDPQGRTLAQADFFTTDQQTVVANVPVEGTRTIYGSIGDVFAWLSIAALVGLAIVALRPTRTRA